MQKETTSNSATDKLQRELTTNNYTKRLPQYWSNLFVVFIHTIVHQYKYHISYISFLQPEYTFSQTVFTSQAQVRTSALQKHKR